MSATILNLRRAEYLWKALALLAISGVVYLSQRPTDPPSGSTWQGYVLGSIGAALIVWLSLLGVRKRQYGAAGQLREWVSAHIYFGLALIGVVLLHSGGQLGWNVHTLSFVLMVVVVLSGIVGTALFVLVPERLSRVRQGRSSAALYVEMQQLDEQCLQLSRSCSPATELAVRSSIERTVIGGSVLDQVLARDRSTFSGGEDPGIRSNRDQREVLKHVAGITPQVRSEAESSALQAIITVLARRRELLRHIRRDVQFRGLLELWLYVHVPVTIGLLAGLLIHVFVVFWYW